MKKKIIFSRSKRWKILPSHVKKCGIELKINIYPYEWKMYICLGLDSSRSDSLTKVAGTISMMNKSSGFYIFNLSRCTTFFLSNGLYTKLKSTFYWLIWFSFLKCFLTSIKMIRRFSLILFSILKVNLKCKLKIEKIEIMF